jgi:hypothetical protein
MRRKVMRRKEKRRPMKRRKPPPPDFRCFTSASFPAAASPSDSSPSACFPPRPFSYRLITFRLIGPHIHDPTSTDLHAQGQTLGQHHFRRPGADWHQQSAGPGAGSRELRAQALYLRQIGRGRDDLEGPPLDHRIGLEHDRFPALPERDAAAATEQETKIGADQKPAARPARLVDREPMPAVSHPGAERPRRSRKGEQTRERYLW